MPTAKAIAASAAIAFAFDQERNAWANVEIIRASYRQFSW